jgi:hypothetical protein
VSRVDRGNGIGAVGYPIAGDYFNALFGFEPVRVDAKQLGQLPIGANQRRTGHRDWRLFDIETLG